jgi:hypothetical protein
MRLAALALGRKHEALAAREAGQIRPTAHVGLLTRRSEARSHLSQF